jgi:pyridoxamine 5'-phosphate oxidase family protein
MSAFTGEELSYLTGERRLARLATVGKDGTPHVTPVGFSYNAELGTIDIGGHDQANTKKYRDVRRTGRAAIVIDDVPPPWQPRGIEVRGRAEAVNGERPLIRIHPERIVSWGISNPHGRSARSVAENRIQSPQLKEAQPEVRYLSGCSSRGEEDSWDGSGLVSG